MNTVEMLKVVNRLQGLIDAAKEVEDAVIEGRCAGGLIALHDIIAADIERLYEALSEAEWREHQAGNVVAFETVGSA